MVVFYGFSVMIYSLWNGYGVVYVFCSRQGGRGANKSELGHRCIKYSSIHWVSHLPTNK